MTLLMGKSTKKNPIKSFHIFTKKIYNTVKIIQWALVKNAIQESKVMFHGYINFPDLILRGDGVTWFTNPQGCTQHFSHLACFSIIHVYLHTCAQLFIQRTLIHSYINTLAQKTCHTHIHTSGYTTPHHISDSMNKNFCDKLWEKG